MENTTFNVSVILPIKSAKTVDFVDFFERAMKSLTTQKVGINELIIVHTNEDQLVNHLNNFDFGNLNVVRHTWEDDANYASQVNFGVENATSEWVTLFEFDDEYSNIWFKNVKTYVNAYSDVEVFLPIVVDVDNKGVFAGFTNEATFAANFTQEIGVLTHETLLDYQNFQTSGMVIKKSTFQENGGFKPSFKLTYGYEFFLRLTNRSTKIMSIPKIGYKHINLREGSIFWNYKNGDSKLTENEVKFWIDQAKKEFYHTQDRNIKYEPQTV